jgi:hypothetical protein
MAKTKLTERIYLSVTEDEMKEIRRTAERHGRNVQGEIRFRIRKAREK